MALLSVNERVRKPAAFGIQNTVGRKQRTVHRVCVRSDTTMLYVRRCKSTGLWVSLKKRHPFHACVRKTRRNTSRYVVARSRHLSCPDPPVSAVFPSKIHERSNKWSSTTCGKWWKEHDDRSLFSFPDSSPPPLLPSLGTIGWRSAVCARRSLRTTRNVAVPELGRGTFVPKTRRPLCVIVRLLIPRSGPTTDAFSRSHSLLIV